jgi:hypothetical protein
MEALDAKAVVTPTNITLLSMATEARKPETASR